MGSGIREAIKRHSTLTVGVMAVLVLAAIALSMRNTSFSPPTASVRAFYTTDDGQTCFVAEADELPPFEHRGKTAYRVWMFTCDGGRTKLPGYLERYTSQAKKRIEAGLKEHRSGKGPMPPIGPGDTEVKKPGSGAEWVSSANVAEAAKVTRVTCPGGAGDAQLVMP